MDTRNLTLILDNRNTSELLYTFFAAIYENKLPILMNGEETYIKLDDVDIYILVYVFLYNIYGNLNNILIFGTKDKNYDYYHMLIMDLIMENIEEKLYLISDSDNIELIDNELKNIIDRIATDILKFTNILDNIISITDIINQKYKTINNIAIEIEEHMHNIEITITGLPNDA